MFHTGTSEHVVSAYLFAGDVMRGGESGLIQIRASAPFVAGPGDRFIVRSLSPVRTIGGGVIIEAVPQRLKRTDPRLVADLSARGEAVRDAMRFAEYCVRDAGAAGAGEGALARRTKQTLPQLRRHLQGLVAEGAVLQVEPDLYVHRDVADQEAARVREALGRYHQQSPASPGMTAEELRAATDLPARTLGVLVSRLQKQGALTEDQGRLALAGHRSTLSDEQRRLLADVARAFVEGGAHPPTLAEVAAATARRQQDVDWAVEVLCQRKELVRIAPDVIFHRGVVDDARRRLDAHIRAKGSLESVDFKYLLDTSRKFALPLLDYFDRIGVTRRVGYTRYLNEPGAGQPRG